MSNFLNVLQPRIYHRVCFFCSPRLEFGRSITSTSIATNVPSFARAKVTKLKIAALAEATYGSHPLLLQLLLLNADASHDRRYMEDMMLRYDSYGWPSFELGLGPSKMDVPLAACSRYAMKN